MNVCSSRHRSATAAKGAIRKRSCGLGFGGAGLTLRVAARHIGAIAEAGLEPAPERSRKRTWKRFLRSHWETLYACDFFSVETLGVLGAVRYMVFFVIELKSRAVQVAGIRIAPDGAWMAQVARNLVHPMDGFLRNASHLIHDRDPLFTRAWRELLESSGVECVPIPARVRTATATRNDS